MTIPTITMAAIDGDGTLTADQAGVGFTISGATTGVETDQIVTITIKNSDNAEVATYQAQVQGDGNWSLGIDGNEALSHWLAPGSFHVSADVQNLAAVSADFSEDFNFIATAYQVTSEAELNSALALVNQGGAANLADTAYTIDINGDFAIDDSVTTVDVGTGSVVILNGAGILSGSGGLSVTSGALNLEAAHTTYTGDTVINGDSTLVAAGNLHGNIVFAASGNGTLIDDAGNLMTNTIKGFAAGDTIEITNDNIVGGISLTQGNVLQTFDFSRNLGVHLQLDPNQDFSGLAFDTPTFVNGAQDLVIKMHNAQVNYTIANEADWNAAVAKIDVTGTESAINTHYTFTLSSGFTLSSDMSAINLADGSSLTVDGGDHIIDGANAYRAIFDYNGAVTVNDLTIKNTLALGGAGGAGDGGGGGGLGAGGAVYVASGGDITLSNVLIESNKAQGGHGGLGTAQDFGGGAGGGIGGVGGSNGGGGGGIGGPADGAQGGNGNLGDAGIVPGAGAAQTLGSPFGGGGGPGEGGGIADNNSTLADRFGGYGGGGAVSGGGGYGGGGGGGSFSSSHNGGTGGYGAGGGGGILGGSGGAGEFGAGDGGDGDGTDSSTAAGGGGGGGAGLGGGIFVEAGGSLSISGASQVNGNDVAAGVGGSATANGGSAAHAGDTGSAFGDGIFIAGSNFIHFTAGANQTITVADNISDEAGTAGGSSGGVIIDGPGTVVLSASNTFDGGIHLQNGTLDLAASNAAGGGAVTFAVGHTATLEIDTSFANAAPSEIDNDWFVGQTSTIDLLHDGNVTSATIGAGNVVTLVGGTHSGMTLNLNPSEDFRGVHFAVTSDLHGGSDLNLAVNNTASSETELNDILRIIDAGGHAAQTNTSYTITLTNDFNFDDNLYAVNLPTGDTLIINGAGHTISGDAGGGQFYRGFFDYAGTLTLENLTLSHFQTAGGAGGNGQGAGGGGAGLGGALFVGADGDVTLDNVSFTSNHAFGGNGGGAESAFTGGGGGGLGGDGGFDGGGGGIGGGDPLSAHGGQLVSGGSGPTTGEGIDGIVLGADSGASTDNSDGGRYGGGGGGEFDATGAGGGIAASGVTGGYGGGGGGAAGENAGDGGFGGGGGGVNGSGFAGGAGDFGGGGGGGDDGSTGGAAGFGAGAGHAGTSVDDPEDGHIIVGGAGGGGLGAGGSIFVQDGGSLTYQTGGTESSDSVAGGLGGSGGFITSGGQFIDTSGGDGKGLGSALFIQGDNTITFSPDAGHTLTLNGTIADEFGNGGIGGKGSITMNGAGTLVLDGHFNDGFSNFHSSFAGGVNFNSGTLELGADATGLFFGSATLNAGAGVGDIRFGTGNLTLVIDGTHAPVGTIDGFGVGDTIDLAGLANPTFQWFSGAISGQPGQFFNQIWLNGSSSNVIALDDTVDMTALTFNSASDGHGGTKLFFSNGGTAPDTTAPTVIVSDSDANHMLAGQTDIISFTFSEAVKNFTNADVTVTGGTLGTISQTDSTHYTATFTPSVTDTLSASIKVNANGYTDLANNKGGVSNTLAITGDTKAPVVTEKLLHDNGTSKTDHLTDDPTISGTTEANATVTVKDGATVLTTTVIADSHGVWSYTPSGLADGMHTLTATATDAAGNISAASAPVSLNLDATAPTLTHFSQNGATLTNAKSVSYDIQFSEAVTGVTASDFTLEAGAPAGAKVTGVTAIASSHGTDYTVTVSTGTGSGLLAADFDGATVHDAAGNPFTLLGLAGAPFTVDHASPMVIGVTTTTTGPVHAGQDVIIDVHTSEVVQVSGMPTLKLNDGGVAVYDAADSDLPNDIVAFKYTAAAPQNVADLKVSSLVSSGANNLHDAAGNLINVGGAVNADLGTISVDTKAPTVTKTTVSPTSGSQIDGSDITFTVTTSEHVNVDANVKLMLNDGAEATLVGGAQNNVTSLQFTYHVGTESTADLRIAGIDQSSGGITDLAGNAISSTYTFDSKLPVNVFTWKGGNGEYSGDNWLPASHPGEGAIALLTAKGTYTVTVSDGAHDPGTANSLTTAKGATLEIAGTNTVFDITGSTNNAGTINIGGQQSLHVGGSVVNSGHIDVGHVGTTERGFFSLDSDTTLSGKGHVTMTDSNSLVFGSSDGTTHVVLTNVDNTIEGAGSLGSSNFATILNQKGGTIDATGAGFSVFAEHLENAGLMEATGGSFLDVFAPITSNSGTVLASGTNSHVRLEADSDVTNTKTGIISASGTGAHVDLGNVTVTGGTLKTAGGGLIEVTGFAELDGSGAANPVNIAGTVEIENNHTLVLKGAINNTNAIRVADGAHGTISLVGDVTLNGAGQIVLTDDGSNDIGSSATATLTNVGNTISGAGSFGNGFLTLFNQAKGVINGNGAINDLEIQASSVTNAGTIKGTTAQGLSIFGSAISNSNLIEAIGVNATVALASANVVNTSKGVVLASGDGAHVDLNNETIVGGALKTASKGIINVSGADTFDGRSGHAVTVAATMLVEAGGNLHLEGSVTNTGAVTVGEGTSTTAAIDIIADTTLAGAGHIVLAGDTSANALLEIDSGVTLTNVANTISGTGTLESSGTIHNAAKGVIGALAGDSFVLDFATVNNDGKIEASGTGHLDLQSDTIHNSATGLIATLTAGATIDLEFTNIDHGTVSISKLSAFDISDSSTIDSAKIINAGTFTGSDTDITHSTVTNSAGGVFGTDGGNFTVHGALVNSGTLSASGGKFEITGAVTGAGNAVIHDSGVLQFDAASSAKVSFAAGEDGTLSLVATTTTAAKFTGNITGFDLGDDIQLGALTNDPVNASLSYHATGAHAGTLTIDDHGGHIIALNFVGDYNQGSFAVQNFSNHVDLLHV